MINTIDTLTRYRRALEGVSYRDIKRSRIYYFGKLYSQLFTKGKEIKQMFKEDPELELIVIEGSKLAESKRKTKPHLELIQGGVDREK